MVLSKTYLSTSLKSSSPANSSFTSSNFSSSNSFTFFPLRALIGTTASNECLSAYFTMVSALLGVVRGLVYYLYEKKDKKVPWYVIVGLCGSMIASYIIINGVILSSSSPWDILYLIASCMYAITFAIRNIRLMRYLVLIPHVSAVSYNLLSAAPISSAISYGIELIVTLVAIVKFELQRRRGI